NLGAYKSLVRFVLEETSNQIRHPGKQFADRTILAYTITHFYESALDRPSHAVEQLELEAALVHPELVRSRLRVRNAANIMRSECSCDDGFVFQEDARQLLEIRVALRFL